MVLGQQPPETKAAKGQTQFFQLLLQQAVVVVALVLRLRGKMVVQEVAHDQIQVRLVGQETKAGFHHQKETTAQQQPHLQIAAQVAAVEQVLLEQPEVAHQLVELAAMEPHHQ